MVVPKKTLPNCRQKLILQRRTSLEVLGIRVRDIEIETCRTHREKESEMMREVTGGRREKIRKLETEIQSEEESGSERLRERR